MQAKVLALYDATCYSIFVVRLSMKHMILALLVVALGGCASDEGSNFQTRYMALCGLSVEVIVEPDDLSNIGTFPAEVVDVTPAGGLIKVCPNNGLDPWNGMYRSSVQPTCAFWGDPIVTAATFTMPASFGDCQ